MSETKLVVERRVGAFGSVTVDVKDPEVWRLNATVNKASVLWNTEEGIVWGEAQIGWPSLGGADVEFTRGFITLLQETLKIAEALDAEFPVGSPYQKPEA